MSSPPTVYFIDDSATMREVIKIAFRRENLNVVACHDANQAIAQMEQAQPDVVISDVIMPEKDGYEVCQYIKQHPRLGQTPVILMSGVVNRAVAEKAFAVKADELIRKPFQPQDLITRVRHLLGPKQAAAAAPAPSPAATNAALSSIFAASALSPEQRIAPRPAQPAPSLAPASPAPAAQRPTPPAPKTAIPPGAPAATADLQKLRIEIMRLHSQVKKLEAELQAEREYSRALEEHIKTLQESE